MPTPSKRPDTIVLVHGFWVTYAPAAGRSGIFMR
jgi:hypothetical protein